MTSEPRKGKLRRFVELDSADQWLLLRAVGWLAVARIRLAITPFARLAEASAGESDPSCRHTNSSLTKRVGFAVRAAANNVPWRSDCFPQAIAARELLRRYGYESTIHLGVEKAGENDIAGHAWLTCGGTVVTGGDDLDRYTEVHRL